MSPSTSNAVLVTGGTGFLGAHVVRALLARGERVRVLARSVPADADSRVEWARGDLREAASVRSACAGARAVVHCGALSAAWGRAADFHAINVDGTQHVLDGCREHGVARLVHVSSPSVVFTGRDQHALTESAPFAQRFLATYSLTKKLAEDRVVAGGVPFVILRPKALFGPGDRSLLPRLAELARAGRLTRIGDGTNLVDLTYVDNAVDAVLAALDRERALGRTYHVTNDEHVVLWDAIERVLRDLELPLPTRRVPFAVAWNAARVLEARARLFGGEPRFTRYVVAILARTQTYDVRAAREDLGYVPRVSVDEGLARTVAAMRGGLVHA